MFGRHSGSGSSGGATGNLIEFRAGRMNMVGKMVHPDVRKGLVYMTKGADSLMHFCWKDRGTGKMEEDLIVFPGEFEYKRVNQCKTGRVYVLICKSSPSRLFYWMQEPKTDKDDEYCRRINELLNNHSPAQVASGANDNKDLQHMLNNMSQTQLNQLFGGVGEMGGLSALLGQVTPNPTSSVSTVPAVGGVTSPQQTSVNEVKPLTPPKPQSPCVIGNNLKIDAAAEGVVTATAGEADPESNMLVVLFPEAEAIDDDRKQQIKDQLSSLPFRQALTQHSKAMQSVQCVLSTDAVGAALAGDLDKFVLALQQILPKDVIMAVDTGKKEESVGPLTDLALEEEVETSNPEEEQK
ncbi:proteasomal ubiquitin receptor ADRM1 homolog [Scaptodrosophila lebanonensis]|uniref:Proteasomal ubiquitin receptor ADRM1 homolog n=1 Tax=Drosophila lebanonensis TaxID=7225 RepID=A0A6J2TD45_DROLE|nr:proteasomal ubiquitin receptor ADRM1 homolog [Scaptodrosophila lebanonensis]